MRQLISNVAKKRELKLYVKKFGRFVKIHNNRAADYAAPFH